jgi:hypothetical protein
MEINILFQRQILAAVLSLLFVFAVTTQVPAKDFGVGKRKAAPAVTRSSHMERGIIIVGGKGKRAGNPAIPQEPVKTKVLTPGSKVSLNPQPLPPKVKSKALTPGSDSAQDPLVRDIKIGNRSQFSQGSNSALNPQPLPPKVRQVR